MSAVPAQGMRARWDALAARERRLIALAVGLISLALLWTLLIEPAWQGRARLRAELPELRAQVAQVEALVAESRRLGPTGGAEMPLPAIREELERSLGAAGIRTNLAQIEVRGDRIEMRFNDVPFAVWLAWLEGAQRSLRLRIVQVTAAREGAQGSTAGGASPAAGGANAAGGAGAAGGAAADRPGNGRVFATVVFESAAAGAARTGGDAAAAGRAAGAPGSPAASAAGGPR